MQRSKSAERNPTCNDGGDVAVSSIQRLRAAVRGIFGSGTPVAARDDTGAKLRNLVESLDDLVLTLDTNLRHDGVYGPLLAQTGLEPTYFLGRSARSIFGEQAARVHECAYARALAGERVVYEWDLHLPSGTIRIHTALTPRRNAAGVINGLIGIGHEVTERHGPSGRQVLSDRLASVGALAAGVAHEISNPLASVMANLELAQHDLSEMTQNSDADTLVNGIAEELIHARESASRVRQLLGDLRFFSGFDEKQSEPIDVRRVVDSVLRMARNEVKYRARVTTKFDDVPPVFAAQQELSQALLSILINVAHTIDEGHVDENELVVAIHGDRDRVCIAFAANVREDLRTRLLPVRDSLISLAPVDGDVGLNLSVSRQLLQALGAEVEVSMVEHEAPQIRISLPAAPPGTVAGEQRESTALSLVRRGHVLVVVHEAMNGLTIRRTLTPEHDVTVVDSARLALEHIQCGERFDAILCDLMMPTMTGMDLYTELERIAPEQAKAVVFLTGGSFTARARAFLERNRSPRIAKPFDAAELRVTIRKQLR